MMGHYAKKKKNYIEIADGLRDLITKKKAGNARNVMYSSTLYGM